MGISCYNNCPGDSRKTQAEGQVSIYCGNASLYGSKATQAPTATQGSNSDETSDETEATATNDADTNADATSTGDAAPSESSPGSAAELAMNAGGVLLAVAGVMAVIV